jgi:serine/threonine protein kinase
MIREMILDRYRIISNIGNGAFGKVYKCYDTKYNRVVALKTGDTRQPRSQ